MFTECSLNVQARRLAPLGATILSELFWPPFGEKAKESFNLPEDVKGMLDTYADRYHTLKTPRKLVRN
jgi:anaphase-promoting complex subunit 2